MNPTAAAPTEAHVKPLTLDRALKWSLGGLSLSKLLSSLGTGIANERRPTFVRAFGATFQGVQWVVIASLLAVTSLIVRVGRLGDITSAAPAAIATGMRTTSAVAGFLVVVAPVATAGNRNDGPASARGEPAP